MGCSNSKDVADNTIQQQSKQVPTVSSQSRQVPTASSQINTSTVKHNYENVDSHARKAPDSVKNSVQDLVNYLSRPSTETRMQVRAFFVWMSENIKYDADGFYGRAQRSPCDALSVMKYGKSVCEGYANVMEALCRTLQQFGKVFHTLDIKGKVDVGPDQGLVSLIVLQEICSQANINVKKLSGYAKGVGHSEDHVIVTSEDTNHAWNAVEIDGKWYLVDGTWGAGHMNNQNTFQKEFEEFYFLTDPEKLINTHFPYMDGNMAESMKWQLLKKPVTLEEFNKKVRRWPEAYEIGVQPLSHPNGLVECSGPIEMVFQVEGKRGVLFMEHLMFYENNMIREIKHTAFGEKHGNKYKMKVYPPKIGKYDFTLFGKWSNQEGAFHPLFKYLVNCKKAGDPDFRYPEAYIQAQIDLCILHEPMRSNLPPNSEVKISLTSPVLVRVMVNQQFLNKTGDKFEGTVKTGAPGTRMGVFGSRVEDGSLGGLYAFDIK